MLGSRFGRIGVLAGGPSNEREISLRSGRAVYSALAEDGLNAVFLDVRDDIHDIILKSKIDVAFIALHGRFGEDGTVQKILEDAGIPYTGSGVEASRLAMDKIESKKAFAKNDIPTARYIIFEKGSSNLGETDGLGLPLVVKPQSEGSSIGLSIVKERSMLNGALEAAFEYGPKALIEEYINGRELTVGVLEGQSLPVVEIVTCSKVYDYKAKYDDPSTRYLVPAPLRKKVYEMAQDLGRRSHRALGCESFSRVDMMADESGGLFVLEVNTIPGMTERSLFPKAARARGITFNELCVKLIDGALNR
ncbi:MAG: hypothetical protein A2987_06055 [Omnitrophica bacterium RIFCSPLOWO2_01_FULL_45_10]|nr:MAG: hypothetical protein A2987_06055 [Omnitrophica bacterium RIFCSPLOWO2_01_FULL_45_10]